MIRSFYELFCDPLQSLRYSGFIWGRGYNEQIRFICSLYPPLYETRVSERLQGVAKKLFLKPFLRSSTRLDAQNRSNNCNNIGFRKVGGLSIQKLHSKSIYCVIVLNFLNKPLFGSGQAAIKGHQTLSRRFEQLRTKSHSKFAALTFQFN